MFENAEEHSRTVRIKLTGYNETERHNGWVIVEHNIEPKWASHM